MLFTWFAPFLLNSNQIIREFCFPIFVWSCVDVSSFFLSFLFSFCYTINMRFHPNSIGIIRTRRMLYHADNKIRIFKIVLCTHYGIYRYEILLSPLFYVFLLPILENYSLVCGIENKKIFFCTLVPGKWKQRQHVVIENNWTACHGRIVFIYF